ncbi:hypothetical protein [uncultured Prevotella sp.]|uniref:hypothetical protein n=1 Tax=uncultured Prevotella sp. TaxID=159272 RepID=UPI0027DB8762|nr:hypothetical protein [uncultured Prevotella sp.]
MEQKDILQILSNEKKGKDERDEDLTSINKDEGNEIRQKYQEEKWRTENELLAEKLKSQQQDRDQRKDFALRIFNFVSLYMFGVFFLLVMSGIGTNDFHLSDTVLVTLLGTTTATVIGVFNFVARYLFHNK